jgi:1-acyl-sn-glycerol-3-phosphate acyltransferase/nucleoside-diphosphate-sugar epimerase
MSVRSSVAAHSPAPSRIRKIVFSVRQKALVTALRARVGLGIEVCDGDDIEAATRLRPASETAVVFAPHWQRAPDLRPDLEHAVSAFTSYRAAGVAHVVVVSSTAIYGARADHAGLVWEEHAVPNGPIAHAWSALETQAVTVIGSQCVTLLRAAPVPVADGDDFYSRLFAGRIALPLIGYDPTLQFLSPEDLASAIVRAIDRRSTGVFNIVPTMPVPLRRALGEVAAQVIPTGWSVQCAVRALLARRLPVASVDQLQFVRYHLTASGQKAARELGFTAQVSSLEALQGAAAQERGTRTAVECFDPHGLDAAFIERCSNGFLGFLHRRYWRIETAGLEHLPTTGAAVLVGIHRGFMPFDGVMTLLTIVQRIGRIPRFLIHPGVGMRFPFLFNLMSKLGGVIACRQNAQQVLESGELLGVYPEGIRGAFTMYKRAHRIGPSWRNDCVAFALRHQVPIVPFVTVGSAEIFPIFGRIDWSWWKKYTGWPFIPVTPTFPLVPLPLPSKWHTLFLEPMHVHDWYPTTASDDRAVIRSVARELKRRMEAATAEIVSRRKSIFFGSLFEREPR